MAGRKISPQSLKNLYQSNKEANQLTKESIETALLFLLEKKELKQISVSELVRKLVCHAMPSTAITSPRKKSLKTTTNGLLATLKRNGMICRTRFKRTASSKALQILSTNKNARQSKAKPCPTSVNGSRKKQNGIKSPVFCCLLFFTQFSSLFEGGGDCLNNGVTEAFFFKGYHACDS